MPEIHCHVAFARPHESGQREPSCFPSVRVSLQLQRTVTLRCSFCICFNRLAGIRGKKLRCTQHASHAKVCGATNPTRFFPLSFWMGPGVIYSGVCVVHSCPTRSDLSNVWPLNGNPVAYVNSIKAINVLRIRETHELKPQFLDIRSNLISISGGVKTWQHLAGFCFVEFWLVMRHTFTPFTNLQSWTDSVNRHWEVSQTALVNGHSTMRRTEKTFASAFSFPFRRAFELLYIFPYFFLFKFLTSCFKARGFNAFCRWQHGNVRLADLVAAEGWRRGLIATRVCIGMVASRQDSVPCPQKRRMDSAGHLVCTQQDLRTGKTLGPCLARGPHHICSFSGDKKCKKAVVCRNFFREFAQQHCQIVRQMAVCCVPVKFHFSFLKMKSFRNH